MTDVVRVNTTLDATLLRRLDTFAASHFEDRSTAIRQLIDIGLREQSKREALEAFRLGRLTVREFARALGLSYWGAQDLLASEGVAVAQGDVEETAATVESFLVRLQAEATQEDATAEPAAVEAAGASAAGGSTTARYHHGVGLPDLVRAGLIQADERIEWRRVRQQVTHWARVDSDGAIVLGDGQRFGDPSPAARALSGGEVNGWKAWTVPRLDGASLAALRDQLGGSDA